MNKHQQNHEHSHFNYQMHITTSWKHFVALQTFIAAILLNLFVYICLIDVDLVANQSSLTEKQSSVDKLWMFIAQLLVIWIFIFASLLWHCDVSIFITRLRCNSFEMKTTWEWETTTTTTKITCLCNWLETQYSLASIIFSQLLFSNRWEKKIIYSCWFDFNSDDTDRFV